MNLRSLALAALVLPIAWLPSCTGGSAGAARRSQPDCGSASKFCLVSCNLGCQVSGNCAITSIAQNQPIELVFSDLIDPATVSSGAVSLKTANGESPAGRFIVDGSRLTFVPEVRIAGGVTTFGFRAGITYILSLSASATGGVLSSSSGDPLARSVVCSLQVTQGLVDLDGKAPSAELVLPATSTEVPRSSPIVLRFSELIDVSSFNGSSTISSPIIYQIRRTIPDPNDPSKRLCEPGFQPILVQGVPIASVEAGSPPRTVVTLQPAAELPNRVCVEVILTSQVRDLAGKSAARRTFLFYTETGVVSTQSITEAFANEARLDRDNSAGTWTAGVARPARFGGRGIHGAFNHQLGTLLPGTTNTWVIDTGNFTIPRDQTLFGEQNLTINDGRFEFTKFVVPAGVRVIFRGSNPAIIQVLGLIQVDGEVSVDGQTPANNYLAGTTQPNIAVPGQAGGAGGAGGGAGGNGGQGCNGSLPVLPSTSGQPGTDARPPASSGYQAVVAGSGGGGGPLYPASGLDSSVLYSFFVQICGMLAGGGGGGSFLSQGTAGTVLNSFVNTQPLDIGPNSLPGNLVPFVALPVGVSSLDHFLVGGAGGGGGGSQPLNMLTSEITTGQRTWNAGAGGAGGGGAIAFRVGHTLQVAFGAVLAARGGGGATHANTANPGFGCASPGGGGSGGSIVVQIDDLSLLSQAGTIDISGGASSLQTTTRVANNARSTGGAGGHGAVRFESAGPITTAALGTLLGPVAPLPGFVGTLDATEGDGSTAFTSLWRPSRQLFAPLWRHYRIVARVQGVQVVYSDNPAEFNPADSDALPFRVRFQGGTVNATSSQLEGSPGPWRSYVNGESGRASINSDNATGLRFMITFNRLVETDVVIEDIEIVFEA
jgi:hypothetical protein